MRRKGMHLNSQPLTRTARATAVACLAASTLLACASRGLPAAQPAFDGEWTIRWCDKTRPNAECGGFWLTLVQRGDTLCGTFNGARVNFAQIDEGQGIAVRGTAKGNVADVTIESGRNLAVYRARATVTGGRLHWTLGETVSEPEYRDIHIIATDHVLQRDSGPQSERYEEMSAACFAN